MPFMFDKAIGYQQYIRCEVSRPGAWRHSFRAPRYVPKQKGGCIVNTQPSRRLDETAGVVTTTMELPSRGGLLSSSS